MFRSILEAIIGFFKFGTSISENKGDTIPYRIPSIESEAKKDSIQDVIKIDKIQDRDLRKEPKEVIGFETEMQMVAVKAVGDLYIGDKETVLYNIKLDFANVLTREQQRKFKRYINRSDKKWFIVRISPLTVH